MCFSIPLKVVSINDGRAKMEDGRWVRLGDLKDIKSGDYLEVYADMAVQKLDKKEALEIRSLTKKVK